MAVSFLIGFAAGIEFLLNETHESPPNLVWEALATPGIWVDTFPFIVLPGQMFGGRKGGFTPHMGDYCVVLSGDVCYPAIIGDSGPSTKIGEASLRLCREINAKANGDVRAVNDLKATYIVFPGSAEKETAPPDLLLWQTRCEALLKELGEFRGKFFLWQQPPPPPPPPPPTPTPAPAPMPAVPVPAVPGTPPIIGAEPPAAPKQ